MLSKQEIPTPALLLDLDAFEASLARMAVQVKRTGRNLRPHAKAHKCVEISRRQIAAGSIGMSVATVSEAEMLAGAGIAGLLLTSPVADPLKIARIVATGAMVAVDHLQQAEWYQLAAAAANRTVDVLVDVDVGDHRTGARSTAQALEIAQAVERAPNLKLRGIQSYSGHASHAGDFAERKRVSTEALARAAETRSVMARAGLSTEIWSGGSTGTWNIDTELTELTELQAGSYVLMDLDYRRVGADFPNALTVLATVVSANHDGLVTVDAGLKAFSTDRGYGPEAVGVEGSAYRWGGDEFGYLEASPRPRLGQKIEFIPPHCDPTVNLHDRIYACRGDVVEAVWRIK
jgi:D-serine deaminase-like pyridoxal phosphate-dependent protein